MELITYAEFHKEARLKNFEWEAANIAPGMLYEGLPGPLVDERAVWQEVFEYRSYLTTRGNSSEIATFDQTCRLVEKHWVANFDFIPPTIQILTFKQYYKRQAQSLQLPDGLVNKSQIMVRYMEQLYNFGPHLIEDFCYTRDCWAREDQRQFDGLPRKTAMDIRYEGWEKKFACILTDAQERWGDVARTELNSSIGRALMVIRFARRAHREIKADEKRIVTIAYNRGTTAYWNIFNIQREAQISHDTQVRQLQDLYAEGELNDFELPLRLVGLERLRHGQPPLEPTLTLTTPEITPDASESQGSDDAMVDIVTSSTRVQYNPMSRDDSATGRPTIPDPLYE